MKRLARLLIKLVRFGMIFVKESFFLFKELREFASVQGLGHIYMLAIVARYAVPLHDLIYGLIQRFPKDL